MKKIFFSLWCLSFLLTGCAKIEHLQELLTLKDLSDDRDQQDIYVKNHDESFERLLAAVKTNSLSQFPDKKSFLRDIGKPVLIKEVIGNGESLERWLYHRSTKSLGLPKIYLYFDQTGKLKYWQYFARDEKIDSFLTSH